MIDDSTYPPAPWRLIGRSIQTLRLIPIDVARRFVPAELHIVSVLPGKTLGTLYCACYGPASTLKYHELIVAPALVRRGLRIGSWISHIYVDHPAALRGGREIWGLPKQLAQFQWAPVRGAVDVSLGSQPVCSVRWSPDSGGVPIPLFLPVLAHRDSRLLGFHGRGHAIARAADAAIRVHPEAHFQELGFQGNRTVLQARLRVRISSPRA